MILKYFSAGDSQFFFAEQLHAISWLPRIWDSTIGFGRNTLVQLWIDYPIRLIIKLFTILEFDWWSIDKILWFVPLMLSIFSIYKLTSFLRMAIWQKIIAIVVYLTNTYALLLFDGGQRGVFLAYSFVPFVVYTYLRLNDEYREWISRKKFILKQLVKLSLMWGILIVFDLRFAYLCIMLLGIYFIFDYLYRSISAIELVRKIFWIFLLPFSGACLLHAFWILPLLITSGSVSLGEEYTSAGMLKFLSVADFSHALSLLHPNWPENLFGKVYFLQPEFLLISVIGFSSLLFGSWIKDRGSWIETQGSRIKDHESWIKNNNANPISNIQYPVSFFLLLVIVGSFFAKGVQPPFGGIFEWMFGHVPGFVMFRDPTKFYLFIALGYSMVIPVALNGLYTFMSFPRRRESIFMTMKADPRLREDDNMQTQSPSSIIQYSLAILFVVFWLFTIRPVFMGTLSGNFRPKAVSSDYIRLKDVLVRDVDPSRVLWLPSAEKFHFSSDIHPVISSEVLLKTSSVSGMLKKINSPDFQQLLYVSGVKYVVIPIDIWKRMFLADYKFAPEEREKLVISLQNTSLVTMPGFTDLTVFKNTSYDFRSQKPDYINVQEYFMRIGLIISAATLFLFILILIYRRK